MSERESWMAYRKRRAVSGGEGDMCVSASAADREEFMQQQAKARWRRKEWSPAAEPSFPVPATPSK